MSSTDPQLLYMVLVLPTLFGLTLVGDGFYKIFKNELSGVISIGLGGVFIAVVIFAYLFFLSSP